MKTLTLVRTERDAIQGTLGILFSGVVPLMATAEPPWKDNRPNLSCIPAGEYTCHWHNSPKYGMCYEVTGVPSRSRILIHSGNVVGDRESGLESDSWGCLLLGIQHGMLKTSAGWQRAVLSSKVALAKFHSHMAGKDFMLRILEV